MTKEIAKELQLPYGGLGTMINPACHPYEFLVDNFLVDPKSAEEFEKMVETNHLEKEYEAFKEGIAIDYNLLKLIIAKFGNPDFWYAHSLNYLSYIAKLHFPIKTKKIFK